MVTPFLVAIGMSVAVATTSLSHDVDDSRVISASGISLAAPSLFSQTSTAWANALLMEPAGLQKRNSRSLLQHELPSTQAAHLSAPAGTLGSFVKLAIFGFALVLGAGAWLVSRLGGSTAG